MPDLPDLSVPVYNSYAWCAAHPLPKLLAAGSALRFLFHAGTRTYDRRTVVQRQGAIASETGLYTVPVELPDTEQYVCLSLAEYHEFFREGLILPSRPATHQEA